MNDSPETPTTTGRRMWRLIGALALPWIVCGGLLWALVGLTPATEWVSAATGNLPHGLSMGDITGVVAVAPTHPVALVKVWNERGIERSLAELADAGTAEWNVRGSYRAGAYVVSGDGPGGRWRIGVIGLWWLLPFPLCWSGFNLWRWTRRAN